MRLPKDEAAAVSVMIGEAHAAALVDGKVDSRHAAVQFVDAVRDLDRFGEPWVDAFLRNLTIAGAMHACAAWRRRNRQPAQTRKGAPVEVPAYAGVLNANGVAVQMRLDMMTADELRQHRRRIERTRNTLSVKVSVIDGLLERMGESAEVKAS